MFANNLIPHGEQGACWSAVVWFCSSLGQSAEAVLVAAGDIDPKSGMFSIMVDYLPITLQLGLLALIPVIVQFTSTHLEGSKSMVEVQRVIYQRYELRALPFKPMRALFCMHLSTFMNSTRYFYFQMMNIFVTIGTVSIFTFIADYSASDIPSLLVNSFPRVGGYFVGELLPKHNDV